MNTVNTFILYSSEGCHLCEQAQMLIEQVIGLNQVTIVDIVSDDQLVDLYGVSIPVLLNNVTQQKLYWPFNQQDVEKIIN